MYRHSVTHLTSVLLIPANWLLVCEQASTRTVRRRVEELAESEVPEGGMRCGLRYLPNSLSLSSSFFPLSLRRVCKLILLF